LCGVQLVEFQSGTQICRAGNSAGPAACENAHLFTLHPALESDPAPVLPVCVCKRPYNEHAAEPNCDAVQSSADTKMLVKAILMLAVPLHHLCLSSRCIPHLMQAT